MEKKIIELIENPIVAFVGMVLFTIIAVIIIESLKFLFYYFMRKVFKIERYKWLKGWRRID